MLDNTSGKKRSKSKNNKSSDDYIKEDEDAETEISPNDDKIENNNEEDEEIDEEELEKSAFNYNQENDNFLTNFYIKKRLKVVTKNMILENNNEPESLFDYADIRNLRDNVSYNGLKKYIKKAENSKFSIDSCNVKSSCFIKIDGEPYKIVSKIYGTEETDSQIYKIEPFIKKLENIKLSIANNEIAKNNLSKNNKKLNIFYILKIRNNMNDFKIKKEYALHKEFYEKNLQDYTIPAQILHLDKNGNTQFVITKRYLSLEYDDKNNIYNENSIKFISIEDLVAQTKDYKYKNLVRALLSLLDLLCECSLRGIVIDDIKLDGLMIKLRSGQVPKDEKIKIVNGKLLEKNKPQEKALRKNLSNLIESWPVKEGRIKINDVLNTYRSKTISKARLKFNLKNGKIKTPALKESKATFIKSRNIDEVAIALLKDFYIILNIVKLDMKKYKNCDAMRKLFLNQLCYNTKQRDNEYKICR